MRYACIYTQRITQKQKKFKDGFVEIKENGNGFYTITIFNEDNQKEYSSRVSDEPILDGSDFLVGTYLIQVISQSVQSPPEILNAAYRSSNFISSSRISASKTLPQKNIPNIVKKDIPIKNNNNKKFIKDQERNRKLRDIPRTYDEIIAFFDVEVDPSFQKKTLIQRNLKEYLES